MGGDMGQQERIIEENCGVEQVIRDNNKILCKRVFW
jgi:hypothetical protein